MKQEGSVLVTSRLDRIIEGWQDCKQKRLPLQELYPTYRNSDKNQKINRISDPAIIIR